MKKRSNKQNSFYHGVFIPDIYQVLKKANIPVTNHDDVKILIRLKFLPKLIKFKSGQEINIGGHEKNLNPADFESLLENIREYFRNYYRIELPYPSEYHPNDYKC